MQRLTDEEIALKLANLNGWKVGGRGLVRKFDFLTFREALNFVDQVGSIADNLDHHPDIEFGWGYASIRFITHDVGGVTERDFLAAEEVNKIQ